MSARRASFAQRREPTPTTTRSTHRLPQSPSPKGPRQDWQLRAQTPSPPAQLCHSQQLVANQLVLCPGRQPEPTARCRAHRFPRREAASHARSKQPAQLTVITTWSQKPSWFRSTRLCRFSPSDRLHPQSQFPTARIQSPLRAMHSSRPPLR